MFPSEKLIELAAQKKLLLLESELNRRTLALYWEHAGEPVRQWQAMVRKYSGLRHYLVYIAPLLGFFLIRRRPVVRNFQSKLAGLWRLGLRLLSFWRFWGNLTKKN